LSIHIIYRMINEKYDEVYVERFHLQKLYGSEPPARSLETNTPLKEYELIITSLHYEPMIAGLVRILYYSGLDPRRERRETPIIAGGPAIMANPYPYSSVIDAFVIGEAETTLPRIIDAWLKHRDSKRGFLEEIASYKYVYVPGLTSGKVYREWVRDLNTTYYPLRQFMHTEKEPVFGKGFILETSRGCRFWCRFCIEGRLFKPYRAKSYGVLKSLVQKGLSLNPVDKVTLYSLIFPSSSDERRLLEYLASNDIRASLPSMRMDYIDRDFLELVKGIGQKTITIAPETFSPYIQRIIGKYFKIDLLYPVVENIISMGFDLKIYILYGIKGETMEDIKTTIETLKRIASSAKEKRVGVSISVNPLIPKPKTVFQWIGMVDLSRAQKILRYFRRELKGLVDTRPLDINWGWVQASIALGDERISDILIEWGIEGGDLGSWRRVLRRRGFSTDYVFRGYELGKALPWDNIVLYHDEDRILRSEYYLYEKLVYNSKSI
ncbi:MAG: radical SAM protein, partial [Thermoprotei archaeon]